MNNSEERACLCLVFCPHYSFIIHCIHCIYIYRYTYICILSLSIISFVPSFAIDITAFVVFACHILWCYSCRSQILLCCLDVEARLALRCRGAIGVHGTRWCIPTHASRFKRSFGITQPLYHCMAGHALSPTNH